MSGVPEPRNPAAFDPVIGIVGSPAFPEIAWSDEQLASLKELGCTTLQLSIAWANKPADEVLNLEDLDERQRGLWRHRITQARKFGLGTIAHFGIPRWLNQTPVKPACILDPEVRDKYTRLLTDFAASFPEVDDIMVYTFDQRAWICSDYGPCPRCSGIPLHERLPGFLDHLKEVFVRANPRARLWWKPWELSKGQTEMIARQVDAEHFGLILNPSTSNECYPFNDRAFAADLGVKTLTRIAAERGIPVIGEIDHTLYKGLYLISDYFPRLVYEQLEGWKRIPGVVGIKEYFGLPPSQLSVNAAMLGTCLRSPEASLEQLLEQVAAPFGTQAAPALLAAWEHVAVGVESFPWDITYLIGPMGLSKDHDGSHDWEQITIPNAHWNTPIWESNRRANFMLTHEHKAHPWLFEDAGLRLGAAADSYDQAAADYSEAIGHAAAMAGELQAQQNELKATARALRGTSLHFLETLAAHNARMVQHDDEQWRKVVGRLERLLEQDAANQGHAQEVAQVLAAFRRDPHGWLATHLSARSHELICTIDWRAWIPST